MSIQGLSNEKDCEKAYCHAPTFANLHCDHFFFMMQICHETMTRGWTRLESVVLGVELYIAR